MNICISWGILGKKSLSSFEDPAWKNHDRISWENRKRITRSTAEEIFGVMPRGDFEHAYM